MADESGSYEEFHNGGGVVLEALTPDINPVIKCEEDEDLIQETCSDIIIEDEYPSAPSSPEVEILEVLSSKTHITVDLTEDDDDEGYESKQTTKKSGVQCGTIRSEHSLDIAQRRPHASESAPLLDISEDENPCSLLEGIPCPLLDKSTYRLLEDKNPCPMLEEGQPDPAFRIHSADVSSYLPSTVRSSVDLSSRMSPPPRMTQSTVGVSHPGKGHHKRLRLASVTPPLANVTPPLDMDDTLSLLLEFNSMATLPKPSGLDSYKDLLTFPEVTNCDRVSTPPSSSDMSSGGDNNTRASVSHGRLSPITFNCSALSAPCFLPSISSVSHHSVVNGKSIKTEITESVNTSQAVPSDNYPTNLALSHDRISLYMSKNLDFAVPCFDDVNQPENLHSDLGNNSTETNRPSLTAHIPNSSTCDVVDLALQNAGISSNIKTVIPTHPNSAFQAVTPSSFSSAVAVSDTVNVATNTSVTVAAATVTSVETENVAPFFSSGALQGNHLQTSLNMWDTLVSVSNSRSSTFTENAQFNLGNSYVPHAPNSVYTFKNTNLNSHQELLFIADNTNAISQYSAGPSTSSSNGNQGAVSNLQGFIDQSASGRSQQNPTFPTTTNVSFPILPVLSPATIIEQTSVPNGSYVQGTCLAGTSTGYRKESIGKSLNSTITRPSLSSPSSNSPSKLLSNPITRPSLSPPSNNPPSPEEPTFSCNICLDSVKTIQSSSRNLCSTVCGHVFCCACLKAALKQKKECPMCRKKLGKKQYHPLFL